MNRSRALAVHIVPVPLLALVALLAALAAGSVGSHDPAHAHGDSRAAVAGKLNHAQLAFHDRMRKLWEDHVTWTRLAIVTFAAGPEESFGATAGRLLQNQTDIGNAIKPFYGVEAGQEVSGLLEEHILIAVDVMTAAKRGDTDAFEDALARWYVNGDEVADALSSLNPDAWPQEVIRAMMKAHLDQTLTEAAAELGGDYAASVASYEQVHDHILEMADALSAGIMADFPRRFRR
jgi:hypothetical protein